MYRRCCLPKCNSLRKVVKFHQFPNADESKRQWLKCINCKNITHSDLSKLYVCHNHFEQRFVNAATKRLKYGAYPSLFTASEISSGKPNTVCLEPVSESNVNKEHAYHKKRHEDHSYCKSIHDIEENNNIRRVECQESEADFEQRRRLWQRNSEDCDDPGSPLELQDDIGAETICENDSSVQHITTDAAESTLSGPHYKIEVEKVNGHDLASTLMREKVSIKQFVQDFREEFSLPPQYKIRIEKLSSTTSCQNASSTKQLATDVNSSNTPQLRRKPVIFMKDNAGIQRKENVKPKVKRKRKYRNRPKFSKEQAFERLTKKMNPLAKRFMWLQIKQSTKRAHGRRFSEEEKVIAQTIRKQSPACYRYLRQMFILPSKTTLKKMDEPANSAENVKSEDNSPNTASTQAFENVNGPTENYNQNINL